MKYMVKNGMNKNMLVLAMVGITTLVLALSIPSIAHSVFGVNSHAKEPEASTHWHDGMMGGMHGPMHGYNEHYEDTQADEMPMEGMHREDGTTTQLRNRERISEHLNGERIVVAGIVVESHHMMVEVEAFEGGEVEVIVPRWWTVNMANGETLVIPGWELVENYIQENDTIIVEGYAFDMPGHCMGGEEGETHLLAYSVQLPEQGITASIQG